MPFPKTWLESTLSTWKQEHQHNWTSWTWAWESCLNRASKNRIYEDQWFSKNFVFDHTLNPIFISKKFNIFINFIIQIKTKSSIFYFNFISFLHKLVRKASVPVSYVRMNELADFVTTFMWLIILCWVLMFVGTDFKLGSLSNSFIWKTKLLIRFLYFCGIGFFLFEVSLPWI